MCPMNRSLLSGTISCRLNLVSIIAILFFHATPTILRKLQLILNSCWHYYRCRPTIAPCLSNSVSFLGICNQSRQSGQCHQWNQDLSTNFQSMPKSSWSKVRLMTKSITILNKNGDKMHPCLTPETIMKNFVIPLFILTQQLNLIDWLLYGTSAQKGY